MQTVDHGRKSMMRCRARDDVRTPTERWRRPIARGIAPGRPGAEASGRNIARAFAIERGDDIGPLAVYWAACGQRRDRDRSRVNRSDLGCKQTRRWRAGCRSRAALEKTARETALAMELGFRRPRPQVLSRSAIAWLRCADPLLRSPRLGSAAARLMAMPRVTFRTRHWFRIGSAVDADPRNARALDFRGRDRWSKSDAVWFHSQRPDERPSSRTSRRTARADQLGATLGCHGPFRNPPTTFATGEFTYQYYERRRARPSAFKRGLASTRYRPSLDRARIHGRSASCGRATYDVFAAPARAGTAMGLLTMALDFHAEFRLRKTRPSRSYARLQGRIIQGHAHSAHRGTRSGTVCDAGAIPLRAPLLQGDRAVCCRSACAGTSWARPWAGKRNPAAKAREKNSTPGGRRLRHGAQATRRRIGSQRPALYGDCSLRAG